MTDKSAAQHEHRQLGNAGRSLIKVGTAWQRALSLVVDSRQATNQVVLTQARSPQPMTASSSSSRSDISWWSDINARVPET